MTRDALVLAGGGVAGIAWETGVLLGLEDSAPQLARHLNAASTRYIGTSAGSTVAAQISSGTPLQKLFDAQIAGAVPEITVSLDLRTFGAMMADATAGADAPQEVRRRIGTIARTAQTPSPEARRKVIESRLPSHLWPERDLLITAINTDTGELRLFDRASGVNLVDAVAASCAVPGIWPPVEIEGSFYMDGGMRSSANADLAAGAQHVLILVPGPEVSPLGPAIPAVELEALGDARVHIVYADDESLLAIGMNPLDPATRGPAAEAGRRLGRKIAETVASYWD
jgi:NTE family protein